MTQKTKVVLIIVGLFMCLSVVYAWYYGYIFSNSKNYSIHPLESVGFFCGKDEILRIDGKHIVTLYLCEDNIKSVREQLGWIVVTTEMGRVYKQNIKSGEEVIIGNGYDGPGGMSIIN